LSETCKHLGAHAANKIVLELKTIVPRNKIVQENKMGSEIYFHFCKLNTKKT
jgi:hypothetical protein